MRLAGAPWRGETHGEGRHNGHSCIVDTRWGARDDSGSLGGAPAAKVACHGHRELGGNDGLGDR